jgi:hypothetical protein
VVDFEGIGFGKDKNADEKHKNHELTYSFHVSHKYLLLCILLSLYAHWVACKVILKNLL